MLLSDQTEEYVPLRTADGFQTSSTPQANGPSKLFRRTLDRAKTIAQTKESPRVVVTLRNTNERYMTNPVFGGGTSATWTQAHCNFMKFHYDLSAYEHTLNSKHIQAVNDEEPEFVVEVQDYQLGGQIPIGRGIIKLKELRLSENPFEWKVNLYENGRTYRGFVNVNIWIGSEPRKMEKLAHEHKPGEQKVNDKDPNEGVILVEVLSAGRLFSTSEDMSFEDDPRNVIVFVLVIFIYFVIGILFCTVTQTKPSDSDEHVLVPWTFIDSLYFCTVTLTTVGYGDLYVEGIGSKIFSCFFLLSGIGMVATAVSFLFMWVTKKPDKTVEKSIIAPFFEKKDLRYTFMVKLLSTSMIGIVVVAYGFVVLVFVDGETIMDSIYASVVTLTTVGYGDITPDTQLGRILVVPWILGGTFVVGKLIADITDFFHAKRKEKERERLLKTAIVSEEDIDEFDLDGDDVVTEYEFLRHMALKMGLLGEEDVERIMSQFRKFDENDDGCVSKHDFELARRRVSQKHEPRTHVTGAL